MGINWMRQFCAGFLILLFSAAAVHAAPLRVVSWDLAAAPASGSFANAEPEAIQQAAAALKRLNPDVILLQRAEGWKTCDELVNALKPAIYNVALCSSFPGAPGQTAARQVAILSKSKPYLSWSEAWSQERAPAAAGGFAFAAIRCGDKNVGLFSAQLGDETNPAAPENNSDGQRQRREESARQLVRQIAALENWQNNRPQAFVVAGDFNAIRGDSRYATETTLAQLEQIGLENVAGEALPSAADKRLPLVENAGPANAADYVFTLGARVASSPLIPQALSRNGAMLFDFDLQVPPYAVIAPQPLVRAPATLAAARDTAPSPAARNFISVRLCIFAGVIGLFLAAAAFVGWRLRRAEPVGENGGHAVLQSVEKIPLVTDLSTFSHSARESFAANLSRWLKDKFVRKLIADRANLMNSQAVASLKMLAVDERLAKIEKQIQERNREYEARIEALVAELANAREENRELIQAKIDLVKAEMARQEPKPGRFFRPNQQN